MKKIYLLIIVLVIIGAFFIVLRSPFRVVNNEENLFNMIPPADFNELQLGRFNENLTILKEMYEENKDDPQFWIGLGNLKSSIRDYQGAIVAYQKCLEIDLVNIVANINIADIYERNLNDFPKAEEYYKKAIEVSPNNYDFYERLARLYFLKMNRMEDAEKVLLGGLEKTNNNPFLLVSLINFYDRYNRIEDKIKYIKILLELYPEEEVYQREYLEYVQ